MKINSVRARCLAAVLAATLGTQSVLAQVASTLPELGDTSAASLTPAMEKSIGEEALSAFRFQDPSYIDDPEIEAYLDSLGNRLSASGKAGLQKFTFFALKDPTINAFAMPGGVVGVHSGLVVTTQSESELASVISHEMAHVAQHHLARSIASQGNSTALLLAAILAAILVGRRSVDGGQGVLAASQAAMIQQQLNYSREYEAEADRIGLQILTAGGFDPQGMPTFFQRMQRGTTFSDGDAPVYLRTHPLTTDRISDMEGRVHTLPYRQVPDSLEYALTRAKLEVVQGDAKAVIDRLKDREGGRLQDQAARWYGLTLAYLAEHRPADARQSFSALQALNLRTPLVASLGARLAIAEKKPKEAARLCHNASAAFPGWAPLTYCEADSLLAAGDATGALAVINPQLLANPQDYRLYILQAKTYSAENKPALAHRAQGEMYLLHGMLPAAVEQLTLAQRSPGATPHEEAGIDARLHELRSRLREVMCAKHEQQPGSEPCPDKDGARSGKARVASGTPS